MNSSPSLPAAAEKASPPGEIPRYAHHGGEGREAPKSSFAPEHLPLRPLSFLSPEKEKNRRAARDLDDGARFLPANTSQPTAPQPSSKSTISNLKTEVSLRSEPAGLPRIIPRGMPKSAFLTRPAGVTIPWIFQRPAGSTHPKAPSTRGVLRGPPRRSGQSLPLRGGCHGKAVTERGLTADPQTEALLRSKCAHWEISPPPQRS